VFLSTLSWFSNDLAIDLGTANTCVFTRDRGLVMSEPSIVAINTTTNRVEAVGAEAQRMLGRTPRGIVAIRPLREGVIADFESAEQLLNYVMKRASKRSFARPRVVIGVPADITQVERRAVRDSAMRAKASEVHLVEEAMAAAIGAGLPITEAAGNMIVDIGGGTTDVAVLSLSGVVYSRSVRVAGHALDDAIMQHAKRTHNLLIGERTAEEVKLELGSAVPAHDKETMTVRGRLVVEGRPSTVEMTGAEIREALDEPVRVIVRAVKDALEHIPPELAADIYDCGIVMTGGGAMLRGLDERLRQETGLPVIVAEEPLSSVVLGAGKMLDDVNLLRRVCLA
jgi:rod shape-determining protein MreB